MGQHNKQVVASKRTIIIENGIVTLVPKGGLIPPAINSPKTVSYVKPSLA